MGELRFTLNNLASALLARQFAVPLVEAGRKFIRGRNNDRTLVDFVTDICISFWLYREVRSGDIGNIFFGMQRAAAEIEDHKDRLRSRENVLAKG